MPGYVQKDCHKDTYDIRVDDISQNELTTAGHAYNSIRLDYEQSRTVNTKTALFNQLYQFWGTHLSYMNPPLPLSIQRMLQTNR